ncbi:MAG TPA: YaiI/YqxD family protein [Patescibacteria group bacterium]|nr:YaiI/YqxD family protein [Patescibacteria group bacterium]
MRLFVDADACPVKDEVLRVAERHNLPVTFAGNSWMRGFDHPLVEQVVASQGMDEADDRIVERIEAGDIVITADIPLAARCVEKGARGIDPRGKHYDSASIGMALAVRDLMTELRDTGVVTGGASAYGKQDRSRFLDGLERLIQAVRRG